MIELISPYLSQVREIILSIPFNDILHIKLRATEYEISVLLATCPIIILMASQENYHLKWKVSDPKVTHYSKGPKGVRARLFRGGDGVVYISSISSSLKPRSSSGKSPTSQ